jgi:DNA-binding transcriptional regulator YdaS (Cro superfamily)
MTEIEIATNGAVSRKDLCVEWDRHWPELAEESRHEKAS